MALSFKHRIISGEKCSLSYGLHAEYAFSGNSEFIRVTSGSKRGALLEVVKKTKKLDLFLNIESYYKDQSTSDIEQNQLDITTAN